MTHIKKLDISAENVEKTSEMQAKLLSFRKINCDTKIVFRSLLRSINDNEFFTEFVLIRDMSVAVGCGETLFLELHKRLSSNNIEELRPLVLIHYYELIELVNYFQNENNIIYILFSILIENNHSDPISIKNIIVRCLPIFYNQFGIDEVHKKLLDYGINYLDLQNRHDWFALVCTQPLALLPICHNQFTLICRSSKSHSGHIAHFLYELLVTKHLSSDAITVFFTLKDKYKREWLNTIRRYSSLIKVVQKDLHLLSDISMSTIKPIDLIFVSTLNLKMTKSDFKYYLLENSVHLNTQELAYCFSQYGYIAKTSTFINSILTDNNLCRLNFKPTYSIKELFSYIVMSTQQYRDVRDHGQVSVILTTHNPNPDLLKISIDSIMRQSYRNIEIILVDDFSNTPEIILGVLSNYPDIKYVRSSKNSGPYVCRNLALIHASGEFIAFQDDDDVSHPQRLEFQIGRLVQTNAKIVAACHIRFDELGHMQMDMGTNVISDGPVTMVMRKNVYDLLGGFRPFISRGDVEFRTRCLRTYGDDAYHHLRVPLYYAFGSHQTLSTSFEHGNFAKLQFQRKMVELEAY